MPGALRQIAAVRPPRPGEAGRTLDLGVDRRAAARSPAGKRAGPRRFAAGRDSGDAGLVDASVTGKGREALTIEEEEAAATVLSPVDGA